MASFPNNNNYEYLRFRSWDLHQKGWKQHKIAEALGVGQSTVCKWIKKAEKQGLTGLKTKKAAGPKAKLQPQDLVLLKKHLLAGAQYHGYSDNVWTNRRIQKLIADLFQINYSVQHVGRIIKNSK